MTKAHLIAWMAENLLASTFIGSGALLALLLATWPLRALALVAGDEGEMGGATRSH